VRLSPNSFLPLIADDILNCACAGIGALKLLLPFEALKNKLHNLKSNI